MLGIESQRWWKCDAEHTKKLILDIEDTSVPGSEWSEGRLEGKQAVVVSVLDTNKDETCVALVRILPGKKEEHRIPVKYLKLHRPKTGEFGVVLYGPYAGLRAPVLAVSGYQLMMEDEDAVLALNIDDVALAER